MALMSSALGGELVDPANCCLKSRQMHCKLLEGHVVREGKKVLTCSLYLRPLVACTMLLPSSLLVIDIESVWQIGLRLLLSPVSSSIVVRAASVAFGLGFPVYLSFKALEKKCQAEQEQWLVYWAVYGCFNVVERISDKLISWFPLYHHAKLAFLLWLQLPNNYGVGHLFFKYMRPFLLKHQSRLDRVVDGSRNDMNNFITSHHKEIQAVGQVAKKIAVSAYKTAEETVRSTRTLYSNTASIETSDDHPPVSRQLSTEDPWVDLQSSGTEA